VSTTDPTRRKETQMTPLDEALAKFL